MILGERKTTYYWKPPENSIKMICAKYSNFDGDCILKFDGYHRKQDYSPYTTKQKGKTRAISIEFDSVSNSVLHEKEEVVYLSIPLLRNQLNRTRDALSSAPS